MTCDHADAAYYEQHRDDPEEWGEPEPAPAGTEHRRLGATITVRLTPDEAELLRALAKREGRPFSGIVRDAVRHYLYPTFHIEQGVIRMAFAPEQPLTVGAQAVQIEGDFRTRGVPTTAALGTRR